MPVEQLQSMESLVFDGAVSPATAVALAWAFAAATAWLSWRDRGELGTPWAVAFWMLRMTAVGVALWMLAGPTRETIHRSTTPQSIAIFADDSQSMEVVDPLQPADALRWALASASDAELSTVTLGDRADAAVGAAWLKCQQAKRQLAAHQPLRQITRSVEAVRVALDRTARYCQAIASQGDPLQGDFTERVERVDTLLRGPAADALDALESTCQSTGESVVGDLTTLLETLSDQLLGVRRRIKSLTRDLVARQTSDLAGRAGEADGLSRREKTTRMLDALERSALADLSEKVRVRRFHFDRRLTPVAAGGAWEQSLSKPETSQPDDQAATNLTAVLQELARDRAAEKTRVAVILTDGRHNDPRVPAPQDVASELADLPVYLVPVGSSQTVRDLRLLRVEAPSAVVEKDTIVIEAIVTAQDCDGLATDIVLRHEGQEIDRQSLQFEGQWIDRRVQFQIEAARLGWQEYELEVEPLEDEASVANNAASISLEVIKDKFRILLADGISRWEFRYLEQLFRRDKHVEFDELLFHPRLRGTGDLAANPRFPEQADDWARYDVVILGDVDPRQLSAASQRSLDEYVRRRGGHLIVIAGRDYMPRGYDQQPLGELLPVERVEGNMWPGGYTLALTVEGQLHRALMIEDSARASEAAWRTIYQRNPVQGLSRYCRPKPTARTLIQAVPAESSVAIDTGAGQEVQQAFLCWQRVGAGRVVYLAAPRTYQLRFRRGDRLHHRFWGQMLRWITAASVGSGSERVRLSTDRTRYKPNEPVEVTVWLKDQTGRPLADQTVHAEARTLKETVATILLEPDAEIAGRYANIFAGLSAGVYEIVIGGPAVEKLAPAEGENRPVRTLVTVEASDQIEMLDTRGNRSLLEQIAETTGGQVVPPTAVAEVLELNSLAPEVTETVVRTPLWNRWTNLWIVLGCLFVEWIVRKQKGLG